MIEPRNMPNLNQSLLGSINTLGVKNANNNNAIDTANAQIYNLSEVVNGYREIIKNTIENTMPKDFGEGCSVEIWALGSFIEKN